MPATNTEKATDRPRIGGDAPQVMTAEEYVTLPDRQSGCAYELVRGLHWLYAIRRCPGPIRTYKANCAAISTNGWKHSDTVQWAWMSTASSAKTRIPFASRT